MMKKPKKVLNVFLLAMMNVAIILSLRALPLMAKEGISLIFYLLFSLFIFLIPTALVSAELATGWPEKKGVFGWVSAAFGEKLGFLAIWLQWLQNTFWYPTVLAFAAGALAYLFGRPDLASNPWYTIAVILVIYWGSTFINLRGIKASGWLSSLGVLLGTILPGILIIFLGFFWWISGKPLAFLETGVKIIPEFIDFSNISLLAGILLLFSGIEVNAVHATEVKKPGRSYPAAIFISVIIIFAVFFLGSLAVAAVVPEEKISLTAGIMQAFAELLNFYKLDWLLPVLGLFIAFGAIGSVAAWIVGPSKGLLATAQEGLLPPYLSKVNEDGVQVNILYTQGIIISVISLLFLVFPNVSDAFFLLSVLAVTLYLIMYTLLFATAIALRYKEPKVKRPYKIPGGHFGIWFVSGLGILGALFAIVIGFFPPVQLKFGSPVFYVSFLALALILALIIPYFLLKARKPSWKRRAKRNAEN